MQLLSLVALFQTFWSSLPPADFRKLGADRDRRTGGHRSSLPFPTMTEYPGINLSIEQLVFALTEAVTTDDGCLGR